MFTYLRDQWWEFFFGLFWRTAWEENKGRTMLHKSTSKKKKRLASLLSRSKKSTRKRLPGFKVSGIILLTSLLLSCGHLQTSPQYPKPTKPQVIDRLDAYVKTIKKVTEKDRLTGFVLSPIEAVYTDYYLKELESNPSWK